MAPTSAAANYSLFSIPAYLFLAMAPHVYSGTLLQSSAKAKADSPTGKGKSGKMIYNLSNPRSSKNADTYSNVLSPATYAKWERARAAHTNMLENSAFFVSAILAGVLTRCDATFMNRTVGLYLFSRLAYVFSYVGVSRGSLVLLRTFCYFVGNCCLFTLWWVAGKKVMIGDY